ncbi:molybdate ABC transporter substrate-binding protein [Campylobacterota bacterium]|nr:molybdate ABC transporter substrate-binding protein [Campylobacterota bacterium]
MKSLILALALAASVFAAEITVAAASSYTNALTEVVAAYKDGAVKTVFAASGKLTAQIEEGAPFDVFLSADMKYPEAVASKGLAEGSVIATVENKLIVWSQTIDVAKGLDALLDKKVKKIAIADPKVAPLGVAAVEALNASKIFGKIESKLVYGENINVPATYVEQGAADIAIVGYSVVAKQINEGKGKFAYIDSKLYNPLRYGTVIIKGTKNLAEAEKFVAFLKSDTATAIFAKHGLTVLK